MKVIILAGGTGTRLWPLSREHYPKQFLKFQELENKSLFQMTFLRALNITTKSEILIITTNDLKFLVMGNIEELGITDYPEKNILIEPQAKNTFPAVMLGMQNTEDEALFLPSDHLITEDSNFFANIEKAKEYSKHNLVIFGIKAQNPNTGYGYIKYKNNIVLKFKEKPNKENAIEYVKNKYLWNSGIFLFDKNIFIRELNRIDTNLNEIFQITDKNKLYSKLPVNSIDFTLFEKSKNIMVIPLEINWTDLGSFDSIHNILKKDDKNNVGIGEYFQSSNNFVKSSNNKKIILQGIDNLIVVDTDDALLICKREESEKIKNIVKKLKEEKNPLCEFHTTIYRPWGHFTTLEEKENYKVKRLTVLPNKSLSLQSHNYRSEHWVIVEGEATITRDIEMFTMQKNESVYIPKKTKHRLENKTDKNVVIIETQSGEYLGEDDIIRFDDKYGRN